MGSTDYYDSICYMGSSCFVVLCFPFGPRRFMGTDIAHEGVHAVACSCLELCYFSVELGVQLIELGEAHK